MTQEYSNFYSYFLQFYGPAGLYPMGNPSYEQVKNAIEQRIAQGNTFYGDSVDRENIRDIVFTAQQIDEGYSTYHDNMLEIGQY